MTPIAPVGPTAAASAWPSQSHAPSTPGETAGASSVSVSATRRIDPPAGTRIILSVEAAETAGASDAFLIWRARGMADSVEIDAAPGDSIAYRTRVLALQMQGVRVIAAGPEAPEPAPEAETASAPGIEEPTTGAAPPPSGAGTETAYRSAGRIMTPPATGPALQQLID